MKLSSRVIVGRRAWTFEFGRWRITARFAPWGTYAIGHQRDSSRFGFAGSASLPFVCVTALQRRKAVS